MVEIALLWERLTFALVDLSSLENGFGYRRVVRPPARRRRGLSVPPLLSDRATFKIGYLACREAT